jgi:hypothetical protein
MWGEEEMLDFNTVGIKGCDDLQDALQIEHSAKAFKNQILLCYFSDLLQPVLGVAVTLETVS